MHPLVSRKIPEMVPSGAPEITVVVSGGVHHDLAARLGVTQKADHDGPLLAKELDGRLHLLHLSTMDQGMGFMVVWFGAQIRLRLLYLIAVDKASGLRSGQTQVRLGVRVRVQMWRPIA